MGARYFNGKGVERNTAKGLYFYLHAASKGSHLSQHNLGLAYLAGDGVNRDEVSALSWFLMGVDHGSNESQTYVEELQSRLSAEDLSRARELSRNFSDRWTAFTANESDFKD